MNYKGVSLGVLTLLTSILCFFTLLLSTPWGTQLTLFLINGQSLQVEYRSGALLNDLHLTELTIKNEALVVKANNIKLQLHLRCLWKKQFCVDTLRIDALHVDIKDNGASSADELLEEVMIPAFLPLPFDLNMKQFSLAKAQIQNDNIAISLAHFSSGLMIKDNVITIEKALLASATITLTKSTLANSETRQTQPIKKTSEPWPLATLPKVSLPFNLTIKSFAVKEFILNEQSVEKTTQEKVKNKAKAEQATKANTASNSDFVEKIPLLEIENLITRLSWFKTKLSIDTLSSTAIAVGDFSSQTFSLHAISLQGNVELLAPYSVDLTLLNTIQSNEVLPQLNDSSQKIAVKGDLSRLAITASSEGALALTTDALVDITKASLPYKIAVNVSKLTLATEVSQVLNSTSFSLKSQGDISQQTLALNTHFSGLGYDNVALTLDAQLSEQPSEHLDEPLSDQLKSRSIKINALQLKDAAAKNALNMVGNINIGNEISWDVQLDSTGITLPELNPDLSGRLQGRVQSKGFWHDQQWAINLVNSAVSGEINDNTFYVSANLDVNHKGELAPSELQVNYGDIGLRLQGYSDKNWHVNGTISVGDINSWLKDIEGSLQAKIAISGAISDPNINVAGEFSKLFLSNVANNITSDAIGFTANYRPLSNHQHQLTLTSLLVNINEHTINKIKLSSHGDLAKQQVGLTWFGDSSVNVSLESQYKANDSLLDIKTNNASFAIGQHDFEASESVHLLYNLAQKTLAINKHCWLGNASQLCLNENSQISATQGELSLSTKVNTELLRSFIPKEISVESTIAGNITLGWQADKPPVIDAKLALSAGGITIIKAGDIKKLMTWQQGQLTLAMTNNKLNADVVLIAPDGRAILTAKTAIPLVNNSNNSNNSNVHSVIRLNDFSLAPLQAFVPELSLLEGMLNTELAIAGDISKPIINGQMRLTQGKAKVLGDINTVENITMAIELNGHSATISGGLNINSGRAELTGNIDWQKDLHGSINLDGESLNFSVPPDLTLTISPKLNAQLTASELKLSGRIEVLEGKLSVDKLPQGSVSLSQDVIIVNDAGEQVIKEKRFNIVTNVRVVIADVFQIEGQGFVGLIGGELQVSQQSQQPLQLFGSLTIPEGRYRAYGQDLSMSKGNISFNGPVKNPYVSMQATRTIEKEDIIVGIEATGLANSLQIKLFSKPSLQQAEVLSYLVRGRGLDAETSGSNAALGLALGTVLTNYSGVLTQIEKLPLLNRIEIDGDDEEASIAGYIGEQVYIKYGIGVVDPINELTVRFYFFSRLWVEAVSGLESSANLYYSFDIQ
ncbi:translocation/assembly module TamB domain-containing protein [Colwellia ponticola]|uniref:Translocation and assembly module TamB C-terminal domain-containing protein n=1 Tax=Colwellia ponticola TaxID=2304625 RepID=A0A8H2JJU6_9GAMM|nr:translocation/assembly module TamB domain-containing protein [Colwellia ponticola]TMM42515.1 hypothetical protein FCS21_14310 [Colwellia ponticola]